MRAYQIDRQSDKLAAWQIPPRSSSTVTYGMRSRMVICGDPNQTDLPNGVTSGLADAVAKLQGIPKLSMIRFSAADVVRHPLVGRIVEAYEGPAA